MVALPYQFYYNGLLVGNGTPYQIIDIDGLADQPGLRVQDTPRGYNDGFLTGRDFYNGRTVTFTLNIFAGNGNSAHANWLILQKKFAPMATLQTPNFVNGDTPLPSTGAMQFKLSQTDTDMYLFCRPRSRKAKIDPEYTYGFIKAQVEFFAPDYRYYSYNVYGVGGNISPAVANGRTYNRTYNLAYNQALPGNGGATATVNNQPGSAATGPWVTITGPCVNPQITNLSTSAFIGFNVSLSAADILLIDMTNNVVTLNGGNARNLVSPGSQFFTIPAGTSQSVYFTALTSTGTAQVTYRQAYA
jgi:hypothetical protein